MFARLAAGGAMSPVIRSRAARCLIAASIIGFTAGSVRVYAQAPRAGSASTSHAQSTAVLVWQGRILPIITDTIASLNELGTAFQRSDLTGVSTTADQFAGELVRFRRVSPTPPDVKPTSQLFIKSLTDLSAGTNTLVLGLRQSNRTEVQQASSQIDRGALEFQSAIDQIRRKSGPAGEPTVVPAHVGPSPTPIIRGMP
jgi:hypothetical protein